MKRLARCSIVLLAVAVAALAASTAFAAPSPDDAPFPDALAAYNQKNYGKAAILFGKAVVAFSKAKKPDKAAQAAYNQGLCLFLAGSDPEKASRAFLLAADQYVTAKNLDGEVSSRMQAAEAFFRAGRIDESAQQCNLVLAKAKAKAKAKGVPNLEGQAEEGLGRIEIKRGNNQAAISHFETAAERYAALPAARLRILLRIAPLKANVGAIRESLALCAEVEKESIALSLSADPKTKADGEYLRFLVIAERGRIENLMGWYEQARVDFEAGIDLAGNVLSVDAAAVRSIEKNNARNTMQLGNLLHARELFNGLLKQARKNGQLEEEGLILADLGQIERLDGRYEEALKLFRESGELFRKTGLKTRLTEVLTRIANLYYAIGMWTESLTNSMLVLNRSLEDNNLETIFIAMMSIFRIEAGKVTGLSGKLDYRTAQGMPWKGSLAARSGSNDGTRMDGGISLAWKSSLQSSEGFFLTDSSIEGFKIVHEAAALLNWMKIRLQTSHSTADCMLRVISSRQRTARKASEALIGLIEGANPSGPEYRKTAIRDAAKILRSAAGESLLVGKISQAEIQTSGVRLEGEAVPETKDGKERDVPGLASEIQSLAGIAARGSLSRGEERILSDALLKGRPIPSDIETRLRKSFLDEVERRSKDVANRLREEGSKSAARNEIAQSLERLLRFSGPSYYRELGGRKKDGRSQDFEKQTIQSIHDLSEAMSSSVTPEVAFLFDAAREMTAILGAWRQVQLRLMVAFAVGVSSRESDSWESCLRNIAAAVPQASVAFAQRFSIGGKKEDIESVRKLLELADTLVRAELNEERRSLGQYLPENGAKSIDFEDELVLRELLARYDIALGSEDLALKGAERILDMLTADKSGAKRRQLEGAANPEIQWRAYGLIGKIALKRGRIADAVDFFDTAINIMEQINPLEGATSQATADRLDMYNGAVEAAFARWNERKDSLSANSLWYVVERMKSRQWRELLATTGGTFLASLPEKARKELNDLRSRFCAAEGGFRHASWIGDQKKIEELAKEISLCRLKINDITAGSSVDAAKPPEPEAIRKLLPSDWNIADYYISDTLSFCLLLSKESGIAVVPLNLDYDSFFGYIVWMRTKIGADEFDNDKFLWSSKNSKTACGLTPNGIYHQLFEPVAQQCGAKRQLLLIPHDVLHVFPMETLISAYEAGKARFLVQDWTFAELPSAFLLTRQRGLRPSKGALIMANPLYGALFKEFDEKSGLNEVNLQGWSQFIHDERSPLAKGYKRVFLKKGILSGDRLDRTKLFLFVKEIWGKLTSESEKLNPLSGEVKKRWGPALKFLAGAQGEAENIAEILKVPTVSSQFQVRENASEKKLKALPLADYNIVHFVCHGYDRASMPDLQPGIALSPVDDPGNDSFLQMGEMTQLPWNADLVTLSACDTGLGDLYPGDGMMGLSTMLLATGNRGTVLSRWRVVDASAPLFMKHFYEEIQKGAGKPQALRNAQLGFLRDREDDVAVPRHWAVFKYVGIPW